MSCQAELVKTVREGICISGTGLCVLCYPYICTNGNSSLLSILLKYAHERLYNKCVKLHLLTNCFYVINILQSLLVILLYVS